jgi:hypothetical protein
MSTDKSASDRALDREAFGGRQSASGGQAGGEQGHDPAKIARHDDLGRDRLFEGREQHDEAEKNSEKTRLARDVGRHEHSVDDDVADAGSGPSAKRKS